MSSEVLAAKEAEASRGRLRAVWPQKCVFVVEEILKTEQDYVTSLRQIIEGYLKPLHAHLFEHAESPISIAAVFGNITQLHEFNSVLEEELTASQDEPPAFGQVFVRNKDNFMYYSEYCTNYKSAVKYLEHLIDRNPLLGAFLAQCQRNLNHSFSLHDRLLKPVQRILKYHLLLENLLRGLGPEHCGYASVSEARMTMSNVADHINRVVKVQEVYSALHNNEATVSLKKLTSDRELVHEGVCRVGRSRELELVLFHRILLFFKKEVDGSYTYEDHILGEEVQVEEDPRDHKHFTISSTKQPAKKYSLLVQVPDDRNIWMDKIREMQTHTSQDAVASERKKTVQNLSRLKLQSSRRQPIKTCRHDRLAVRISVPAQGSLLDMEQPQERTLSSVENQRLQRSKAVRLRKGLSTGGDASPASWRTSDQWRPTSELLGAVTTSKVAPTSHVLQASQDDSNGSPLPDQVNMGVAINIIDNTDDVRPHPHAPSLSDDTPCPSNNHKCETGESHDLMALTKINSRDLMDSSHDLMAPTNVNSHDLMDSSHDLMAPTKVNSHDLMDSSHDLMAPTKINSHDLMDSSHDLMAPTKINSHDLMDSPHDLMAPTKVNSHDLMDSSHDLMAPTKINSHDLMDSSHDLMAPTKINSHDLMDSSHDLMAPTKVNSHDLMDSSHDLMAPTKINSHDLMDSSHDLMAPTKVNSHDLMDSSHDLMAPSKNSSALNRNGKHRTAKHRTKVMDPLLKSTLSSPHHNTYQASPAHHEEPFIGPAHRCEQTLTNQLEKVTSSDTVERYLVVCDLPEDQVSPDDEVCVLTNRVAFKKVS